MNMLKKRKVQMLITLKWLQIKNGCYSLKNKTMI